MAGKTDPAKLARQARDLVEQVNRTVLDDATTLSAPVLSETTYALKELVERLPQAFDQITGVLEMRAAEGKVVLEPGRPAGEVATTAVELRDAAAGSEQLAKTLSHPASALFLMGGR